MLARVPRPVITGGVAAGLALTFAVVAMAQRPPRADVINQIKSRTPAVIADALRDLKLPPPVGTSARCKAEFDQAARAAETEATQCLNFDTAPANSPIGEYKANELAATAKYCQTAPTAGACAQNILDAQAKFCAKERAKDMVRAKVIKAQCEAEVRQCTNARTELQKTRDEIARLQRLLVTLEQKVSKECP